MNIYYKWNTNNYKSWIKWNTLLIYIWVLYIYTKYKENLFKNRFQILTFVELRYYGQELVKTHKVRGVENVLVLYYSIKEIQSELNKE